MILMAVTFAYLYAELNLADAVTAVGSLMLGCGTITAAILAGMSRTAAKGAHETAAKVDSSVGSANGATLIELMHKFNEYEEYAHKRNHDVLGQLTLVTGGIPLLIQLTERQNDALDRQNELLTSIAAKLISN